MEPVVLAVRQEYLEESVPVRQEVDLYSPTLMKSLQELISSMPDIKVRAITQDLDLYERTGHMTRLIEDVLRRAQCLADADRIMESF
jgi:hypothetical protein